jgi:hypothetical protein
MRPSLSALTALPLALFASASVLAEPLQAAATLEAATPEKAVEKPEEKAADKPIAIRGYIQFRTSERVSGEEGFSLWSDRSVGDRLSATRDNNFVIRRGRLIFSRDITPHVGVYIQPDFGSSAGTTGNVLQLRDAYADLFVDATRVHRFRVGQSKVPFGWENMQSSQNRLGLDRADALNSAVRDERDTGVFYYYTPKWVQESFKEIEQKKLKHSGNYGMFGLGVYNGQGANRQDTNESVHTVVRFNVPGKTQSGQLYEFGVQGFTGKYVPSTALYTNAAGVRNTAAPTLSAGDGIKDQRVAVSGIIYPQPFGLQAEWTWGKTPGMDATRNLIEEKSLQGGYVQAMYMLKDTEFGTLIPFVRYQSFDGYNRAEPNAPRNKVNDVEVGLEWQMTPNIELTTVYHHLDRGNLVTGNRAGFVDYRNFQTNYVRMQMQVSY